MILYSDSCHPCHVSHNIPFGEMVRARRNCSSVSDFLYESCQIQRRLSNRKYPDWILKQAHDRALHVDISLLIRDNYNKETMPASDNNKNNKKTPIAF